MSFDSSKTLFIGPLRSSSGMGVVARLLAKHFPANTEMRTYPMARNEEVHSTNTKTLDAKVDNTRYFCVALFAGPHYYDYLRRKYPSAKRLVLITPGQESFIVTHDRAADMLQMDAVGVLSPIMHSLFCERGINAHMIRTYSTVAAQRKLRFLFIGQFFERKNVDALVRVFKQLKTKAKLPVTLTLKIRFTSRHHTEVSFREIMQSLGYEQTDTDLEHTDENIFFTGKWDEDVAPIYQQHGNYISLSHGEGLNIPFLDARAMGLKIWSAANPLVYGVTLPDYNIPYKVEFTNGGNWTEKYDRWIGYDEDAVYNFLSNKIKDVIYKDAELLREDLRKLLLDGTRSVPCLKAQGVYL